MPLRHWAVALGLTLALCAGAARAETATLTAPELRDLAFAELQAGHFEAALTLTDGLLARDPEDAAALIVRSQALRALGRAAEAEKAARAAFAAADTMSLRYGAALGLAQALSVQGERLWAQVWLRRAAHFATTDEQRARVAGDYQYVRDQNPLKLNFSFSALPSSNVNNGAMRSVWDLFGIPLVLSGDAQALSGIVADTGVSGSYRISQTTLTYDALTFGLDHSWVYLSPEARAQAPTAKNADYALSSLSFGYQHRDLLAMDGTILTSAISVERSWYGGPPLSNALQATFDLTRPLGPVTTGFGHLGLTANQRLDNPLSSANIVDLSLGTSNRLANGDTLTVSVEGTYTASDDIMTDNRAVSARLDWAHAKPVQGVLLSGALEGSVTYFPVSPFALDGRHDTRLTASLSADLAQVSIYGFSPVVTMSYSANNSNIGLYDTRTFGVGVSFRSRF